MNFQKILAAQLPAMDFQKILAAQVPVIDFQKILAAQLQPLTIDFQKVLAAQVPVIDFQKILAAQLQPLTIDFQKLLTAYSAIATDPGLNESARGLTLSQQRLLVGYFVYILTWLMCLYFVICMLSVNPEFVALFSVFLAMTGASGHSLASMAKDMALRAFDYWQPSARD